MNHHEGGMRVVGSLPPYAGDRQSWTRVGLDHSGLRVMAVRWSDPRAETSESHAL